MQPKPRHGMPKVQRNVPTGHLQDSQLHVHKGHFVQKLLFELRGGLLHELPVHAYPKRGMQALHRKVSQQKRCDSQPVQLKKGPRLHSVSRRSLLLRRRVCIVSTWLHNERGHHLRPVLVIIIIIVAILLSLFIRRQQNGVRKGVPGRPVSVGPQQLQLRSPPQYQRRRHRLRARRFTTHHHPSMPLL